MSRVTPGQSRHRLTVPAAPMAQDKLDSGPTCDLARHLTIPDARWRPWDSDRIASRVVWWCSQTPISSQKGAKLSTEGSAYPTINTWVVSGQRLQGDLEKFHQRVVRERLVEQPDGPRDRCTTLDSLVVVSGDEDEREIEPIPGQLLLHLESVHTGHLHVKQNTVGPFRRRKVKQEQLAGGED